MQETKQKENKAFAIHGVICLLFHKITIIDNCHFVDKVTGKSVGKFKCEKCKIEYLANNKRSWFRFYS